jgi:integrase-like protein
MARKFAKLTAPAIKKLQPGQRLTEHGITFERVTDGDGVFSVNIMVDGQRIRRVVAAAGLDPQKIVRHTLRHTAITHLVQAGVDLPTVKRVSGHKTLAMVERYSHANGAHVQSAMDQLQQTLNLPVVGADTQALSEPNYTETTPTEKARENLRSQALESAGRPCRIRTCDQRIKSPLLYHLS